ncbi:hypothetical protein LTR36_000699 [Oleoguttula mirabilis]|uniref:Uncharacterized protein n=1 Tax=Oleoguttula mirabilis TaxID=1507867 RepID=A0AAV9JQ79_9PEZI|nr:hypothetical protein LTR36_000699 [Oleoguttula mirabilis]
MSTPAPPSQDTRTAKRANSISRMRDNAAHDLTSISAVDRSLRERNRVQDMTDAERYFADERYDECAQKCYAVVRAEVSEAIQAKCHMYLATEAVGPEEAAGRAYHAAMAMQMWRTVIERTGSSRFPIDQAKVKLAFTQTLFDKAEALVRDESEPLPLDDG